MVQPHALDRAVVKGHAAFFYAVELPVRRHLAHIHRKIRVGHLRLNRPLQTAGAVRGMEIETIVLVGVKWREKRNSLNMVPMKVGKKDMSYQGMPIGLLRKLLAQVAKARATVKYVDVAANAHLHAGGITSVAQVF